MQIIKFAVLVFVLVARLCRAEVSIASVTLNQKTLDVVEDLVTIVTSCYGDRIDGIALGGDLPDTLLRRLSTQHLIPVVLMNNDAKLEGEARSRAPVRTRRKLHSFIVEVYSMQQLLKILRYNVYPSIWCNFRASYFLLVRSPECKPAVNYLHFAWIFGILNAKVMCYGDNSRRIIVTLNPFTSLAPVPWKKIWSFAGEYGHPHTVFSRELQVNETMCVNLEFDKTKDCGGYPINVKGVPLEYTIRSLPDFAKASKKDFSTLQNIVFAVYRGLNVTPRYFKSGNRAGIDFQLRPTPLRHTWRTVPGSYPIFQRGYILLTQFRGNKSQLQKILGVIDSNSHIGLGIVYSVTLIFFKFVVRQALVPAILNLIRITCGIGFENLPRSNPSRIYLTGVLFFAVTMLGIFQGNLATLLTTVIPVRNVNTLQDILDFDYTIYIRANDLTHFLNPEFRQRIVVVEPLWDCTMKVKHEKSAACMVTLGGQALDIAEREHLHPSQIVEPAYFVFRLSWSLPYEERFNKILSTLVEADILETWNVKCNPFKVENYQIEEEVKQNKAFKILELSELTFAFTILGIGLVLASITFVVELGIHYRCGCRRICRFGMGTIKIRK